MSKRIVLLILIIGSMLISRWMLEIVFNYTSDVKDLVLLVVIALISAFSIKQSAVKDVNTNILLFFIPMLVLMSLFIATTSSFEIDIYPTPLRILFAVIFVIMTGLTILSFKRNKTVTNNEKYSFDNLFNNKFW